MADTPRSANTETLVCESCDGFTIPREVVPPHPVWTDAQENAVVQMNAIALGGMFGLNA